MNKSDLKKRIYRCAKLAVVHFVQMGRIFFYEFISTAKVIGNPVRRQAVHCVGNGEIVFGHKVSLGFSPSPSFLNTCCYLEARNRGARISIGDNTQINNNFVAVAEHTSIDIGSRVLIGINVEILDSNFHGVRVEDRMKSNASSARSVVIEDDVFIASNVKILRGVRVGAGSVIANGAVVIGDVPARSIAAGNPAKVVKQIE